MGNTGKFITFEGIEGSGKSTQIQKLSEYMKQQKVPHILTREPGATEIGKKLRAVLLDPGHTHMDPRCEALLYMADRSQHLTERVIPALRQGTWVLCDRYHDSTLVYQGFARGIPGLSYDGFLVPDLTFVLDMKPGVGLKRARIRNDVESLDQEARFENEALSFHRKVRQGFLELVEKEPKRVALIQAFGTPDEVYHNILPVFNRFMEMHRV